MGGVGTMYDVHVMLIGKRIGGFLLVLIELCSLGIMAEALRSKIYRKSAFCKGWVSILQILTQKGTSDTNHLCTDSGLPISVN